VAGKPYRDLISSHYDLVAVEVNCFLEPNLVIIESVPE